MDQLVAIIVSLAGDLPFVGALRSAVTAYALVSAMHVLCIGVLVGSIIPLDLGIVGMNGFRWAAPVTVPLRRMAIAGFAGALSTGIYMFAVRPLDYLNNPAFLIKLAAIFVAGLNLFAFCAATAVPLRRLLAVVSLMIWISVLLAGRRIGFV